MHGAAGTVSTGMHLQFDDSTPAEHPIASPGSNPHGPAAVTRENTDEMAETIQCSICRYYRPSDSFILVRHKYRSACRACRSVTRFKLPSGNWDGKQLSYGIPATRVMMRDILKYEDKIMEALRDEREIQWFQERVAEQRDKAAATAAVATGVPKDGAQSAPSQPQQLHTPRRQTHEQSRKAPVATAAPPQELHAAATGHAETQPSHADASRSTSRTRTLVRASTRDPATGVVLQRRDHSAAAKHFVPERSASEDHVAEDNVQIVPQKPKKSSRCKEEDYVQDMVSENPNDLRKKKKKKKKSEAELKKKEAEPSPAADPEAKGEAMDGEHVDAVVEKPKKKKKKRKNDKAIMEAIDTEEHAVKSDKTKKKKKKKRDKRKCKLEMARAELLTAIAQRDPAAAAAVIQHMYED